MSLILIADDDAMFRAIMTRLLNQMGFDVIEKASGKGVKTAIEQQRPVACLIDLIMDEQEGIETILEIQQLADPPKVIAVSSNAQYLECTPSLGADAILLKPVLPDRLKAALSDLGVMPTPSTATSVIR